MTKYTAMSPYKLIRILFCEMGESNSKLYLYQGHTSHIPLKHLYHYIHVTKSPKSDSVNIMFKVDLLTTLITRMKT